MASSAALLPGYDSALPRTNGGARLERLHPTISTAPSIDEKAEQDDSVKSPIAEGDKTKDVSAQKPSKHPKMKGPMGFFKRIFGNTEELPTKDLLGRVEEIDVGYSKWISNHDDRDREHVTLHCVGEDSSRSFRWVHRQRSTEAVKFDKFKDFVQTYKDLDSIELAVATKCLEEVRKKRKQSVRGCHFDSLVHMAKKESAAGGQKVPICATFVSIPVLALFDTDATDCDGDKYPSSRNIRLSDDFPIRALLQYSNLLNTGYQRDREQVITRLDLDEEPERMTIVQVPELWAIVINMYTLITCAPFSVEDLCGKNITLRDEASSLTTKAVATSTVIKYTDRRGNLRDLPGRMWPVFVEALVRAEAANDHTHRVLLTTMLNHPGSEFQLVDSTRFQPVDKQRWIDLVANRQHQDHLRLRLARTQDGSVLDLLAAQSHHKRLRLKLIVLAASELCLEGLRNKRKLVTVGKPPSAEEARKLRARIRKLESTIVILRRSVLFSRWVLFAASYRLFVEDDELERKMSRKMSATESEKASVPLSKSRRGPNRSYLWPFGRSSRSRTSSPTNSQSSHGDTAMEDPNTNSPTTVPNIILNDEPGSHVHLEGSPVDRETESIFDDSPLDGRGSRTALIPASKIPPRLTIPPPRDSIGHDLEAQQAYALGPGLNMRRRSIAIESMLLNLNRADLSPTTRHDFLRDFMQRSSMPSPQRAHKTYPRLDRISRPMMGPSPPRRPLALEGDGLASVARTQPAPKVSPSGGHSNPGPENAPTRPLLETKQTTDSQNDRVLRRDLLAEAESANATMLGTLRPFFEWHTEAVGQADTDADDAPQARPRLNVDVTMHREGPVAILDSVDAEVLREMKSTSNSLPEECRDWAKAEESSEIDVIRMLDTEWAKTALMGGENANNFHAAKESLFLSVRGIISCFLVRDRFTHPVVSKMWGVMRQISAVSARQVSENGIISGFCCANTHQSMDTFHPLFAMTHPS
jgi:hypothetical protein